MDALVLVKARVLVNARVLLFQVVRKVGAVLLAICTEMDYIV